MSEHIDIASRDGVLTLAMNRPDKKNALTDAMYAAMSDAMDKARTDTTVRAVVIRGTGEIFTAGNDIGDFMMAGQQAGERSVFRFLRLLASFEKPLVAGVQGKAVGIGTTLLLHCDYVVLAEDAQLSTPFVKLGLVPEAASSVLLPARIGHAHAFAMLAMGQPMEAAEARECGLANEVVPPSKLDQAVDAAVTRIAALPPEAVAASKKLMRETLGVAEAMEREGAIFGERLLSAEAREAFTAFMEKRAPKFG